MCYKYIMIASMVGGSVEEKEDWRKENSRQGSCINKCIESGSA